MVVAQKKKSLFAFWKKVRFEGGEEENDLWVHALFEITLVLLSFFLIFFLSSCFVFSFFFTQENILYFSILITGHGKSLFIVPVATIVLPFCPLTTFVWSRRTCRPPEVCATHPCQTEASFSSALP